MITATSFRKMPKNAPFTRMCISCHARLPQTDMIRVVKNKNGEFKIGKQDGRSSYICSACIDKVVKRKLLNKAFRCNVPIEVYEELGEILMN